MSDYPITQPMKLQVKILLAAALAVLTAAGCVAMEDRPRVPSQPAD